MKRLAGILLAALLLGAQTPPLNRPSPGGGNAQTQQKPDVSQKSQDAGAHTRGTEDAPLVVQITQPQGHEAIATKVEGEPHGYTNPDWWVAGATIVLAAVTTGLWIVTWLLWSSTKKLVGDERGNNKIAQRAYVSSKGIEQGVSVRTVGMSAFNTEIQAVDGYVFWVTWKNTGQTPAKNAITIISRSNFSMNENRPNFLFEMAEENLTSTDFGPGSEIQTGKLFIPIDLLNQCYHWEQELLIWARVEYFDVMDPTIRRHTEICARVDFISDPTRILPKDHPNIVTPALWGPQNRGT